MWSGAEEEPVGCKYHTEWMDGGWGKRLRVKESQWLVHRLLLCSDECFISFTILLVGYLLSPSCRLTFELESQAGLGPGDNPWHCVSVVSLLQLNNKTINCDCLQFSENISFHVWDEMWTVILQRLHKTVNNISDFSVKYARISPSPLFFPLFLCATTTWSPDPWFLKIRSRVSAARVRLLCGVMVSVAPLSGWRTVLF